MPVLARAGSAGGRSLLGLPPCALPYTSADKSMIFADAGPNLFSPYHPRDSAITTTAVVMTSEQSACPVTIYSSPVCLSWWLVRRREIPQLGLAHLGQQFAGFALIKNGALRHIELG
jgi:hypothetical protein